MTYKLNFSVFKWSGGWCKVRGSPTEKVARQRRTGLRAEGEDISGDYKISLKQAWVDIFFYAAVSFAAVARASVAKVISQVNQVYQGVVQYTSCRSLAGPPELRPYPASTPGDIPKQGDQQSSLYVLHRHSSCGQSDELYGEGEAIR